jgi:hypothetical protein
VDALIGPLHNRNLNEMAPFNDGLNPSAEHVAWHVGRSLAPVLPAGIGLVRVEVWETSSNRATYIP